MTPGKASANDLFAINRSTLASKVLEIIRQAIDDGVFEAGEQLTESRLADQFKVSRAPVREALRKLDNEGLVVYFPHRGYFVRTLTIEDVEELFQLRTALEGLAVSVIIDRIGDEQLAELEQIVAEMGALSTNQDDDHVAATELDAKFHEALCALSGNQRLVSIWSRMRRQIRIAVLAANSSFQIHEGFTEGHRAILDAIHSRDHARAGSAIKDHIQIGLASLRAEMAAGSDSLQGSE